MDCHFYLCFYPWDVRRSIPDVLGKAAGQQRLVRWLSRAHPVLVGEWSAALDHRTFRHTPTADRPAVTERFV